MKPTAIRNAQIASSAIIIILATAIIGCAGHTLQVFNSQNSTNPWWLPLWPDHFDTRGTNSLIGTGATMLVLNLIHVIVIFITKLNLLAHPTHRALLTVAVCIPACMVSLSTIVYAHILNGNSPSLDTIQTWTCRFDDAKQAVDNLSVPTGESNKMFSQLCHESKFALYGTLIVFLLQGLMLVVAVFGWVVEKWTQRKSNKEWKDGSSVEMNGMGDKGPNVAIHQMG